MGTVTPVPGDDGVYELSALVYTHPVDRPAVTTSKSGLRPVRARVGREEVTVVDQKTQAKETLVINRVGDEVLAIYDIELPTAGTTYDSRGSTVILTNDPMTSPRLLYPQLDVHLPESSMVSPVCIEGAAAYPQLRAPSSDTFAQRPTEQPWSPPLDRVHPLCVQTNNAAPTPVAFLTSDHWYANVPLKRSGETEVIIDALNRIHSRIHWTTTPLGAPSGSPITIRADDSLLFEAITDCRWSVLASDGTSHQMGTLKKGETCPHAFHDEGDNLVIVNRLDDNTEIGRISVRAVAVSLNEPIAVSKGFELPVDVAVVPPQAIPAVEYESSDPSRLRVQRGKHGADWQRIPVTPLSEGSASIVARIGPRGPILGLLRIDGFTLDTSAFEGIQTGGNGKGAATVTLKPLTPGISIHFTITDGPCTFPHGQRELVVRSSDPVTDDDHPGFEPRLDPASGMLIGDCVVPFENLENDHGHQITTGLQKDTNAYQGPDP